MGPSSLNSTIFVCSLYAFLPYAVSLGQKNPEKKGPGEATLHYVISLSRCPSRMAYRASHVRRRRSDEGQEVISPAVDFTSFSPLYPPIPVVYNQEKSRPADFVTAGQVACTASHRAVWTDALHRNASAIVVLEDDVLLSSGLRTRLPLIIQNAHLGAIARRTKWHWIFLRRVKMRHLPRQHWHGDMSIAAPSWGTAAYVLSRAGVSFMLANIRRYEEPLDLAVARLQRSSLSSGFVALDACLTQDTRNCPLNVVEIPLSEQGECAHSTTQSGWRVRVEDFRCAWP